MEADKVGTMDKFGREGFVQENVSRKIEDEYSIDSKAMGEGAYGEVSRAVNKKTGLSRAVKVIPKSKLKNLPRFRTEIELMKTVEHPNIVKLFEVFEDVKNVYLLMELCTGGEMFDRIINAGHFSEKQAATYVKQILLGVNYLHGKNIMHRDLKPENLLFLNKTPDSPLKLIDFGLAMKFEPGQMYDMRAGTPYYVAPQILEGRYDHKCDIWSVGVITYVLLCGYPPFFGDSDQEILARVRTGKFSFPEAEWRSISKDAKDLISKLLEFDATKRISAEKALSEPWIKNTAPNSKLDINLEKNLVASLRTFRAASKLKKVALAVIAQQLNESEIETLRSTFQALDTDGSGNLSFREVREGMIKSNVPIPADLDQLLGELDTDGSGKIDYTEFIAATMDRKTYMREDVLWAAFRVFDLDGSGTISKQELMSILAKDSVTKALGMKQIESMIKEVDVDGDGEIDFDEFMQMMRKGAAAAAAAT